MGLNVGTCKGTNLTAEPVFAQQARTSVSTPGTGAASSYDAVQVRDHEAAIKEAASNAVKEQLLALAALQHKHEELHGPLVVRPSHMCPCSSLSACHRRGNQVQVWQGASVRQHTHAAVHPA